MATVSRVLNGYSDVSAETRRGCWRARKLDYTPNAAARTLVKRRSQPVAILFTGESNPDLQHPFFLEVLVGLKHSSEGRLRRPPFARAAGIGRGPHAYARRARHHGVDGVVVLAVDDAEEPELQKRSPRARRWSQSTWPSPASGRATSPPTTSAAPGSRSGTCTASVTGASRRSPGRRTRSPPPTACSATGPSYRSSGSPPGLGTRRRATSSPGERRGSDAGAARPPGAADRGLRGVGHDGRRAIR